MKVLDHTDGGANSGIELWRPGVKTMMRNSALTGAHSLCIFEQFCDPGLGAPIHIHAVEEVLEVMEGEAEIWLDDQSHVVRANQSVLVPAGHKHGFKNIGTGILKVRATLASPIFEASYDVAGDITRRYNPV
jgi:mannose-6-phosphate isomerase-like protein (cupin superfamily)